MLTDKMTWSAAALMCKAHDNNAHLLVIDSAAKQLAIGVWTSANSGRTSASILRTQHIGLQRDVINEVG